MNTPQISSTISMMIFDPVIVGISRKLKHESCGIFSIDIENVFICDVSSSGEEVMPVLPTAVQNGRKKTNYQAKLILS